MFNYFKMNLFKAALTPELRGVFAQKDHDTMKIKKMYHVTTTAHWEGEGKSPASINEVWEDKITAEVDDNENNQQVAQPKWIKPIPRTISVINPIKEVSNHLDLTKEEAQTV